MTSQEVKRKLTVIFSADVKGYSRLMGEDEKGTVSGILISKPNTDLSDFMRMRP